MKIRNGFVSNSSSSSFAIFGATLDCEEFRSLMKDLGIEIDEDEPLEDAYDALDKITKGLNLEYYVDEESNVALGRSYSTLRDDETGAQFKEETAKDMQKALGKAVECEILIETWSS